MDERCFGGVSLVSTSTSTSATGSESGSAATTTAVAKKSVAVRVEGKWGGVCGLVVLGLVLGILLV